MAQKQSMNTKSPRLVPNPAQTSPLWRSSADTIRMQPVPIPPKPYGRQRIIRFRPAHEVLRTLDLFSPVSDGELLKFAGLGFERRITRDHRLEPASGRGGKPLGLILEGEALLCWGRGAEELFLQELVPGDLLGEFDVFQSMPGEQSPVFSDVMSRTILETNTGVREREVAYRGIRQGGALLDGDEDPAQLCFGDATARALTMVRLLEWDADAVREALRRWPDVSLSLLSGMAKRQRDMQRRVASLGCLRAPGRLARTLTALAEERGSLHRDTTGRRHVVLSEMPSRTRLSDLAGMARETVSRLLADWERKGWIAGQDGNLVVLDGAALKRLAGGL